MRALLALYAFAGGLTTFVGWTADVQRLTDWVQSGISMMPNMALALMLAGAALLLMLFGHPKMAAALGFLTGLIGAATLFQHVTGINLGIDALIVSRPWGHRGTLVPGRMGPPGSASLTIIGIALMLAASGRKNHQAAAVGGILVIGIALLSIAGYIFGADSLYSLPRLTVIAFQTATMLLALGIGLVMSVPEAQPMKLLREHSAAAVLVRRALPFIVLVPIVVGWLRVQGEYLGWYDSAFGTALRTIVEVALLVGLLWWAAASVKAHEQPLRESETRKAAILRSSLDAIVSMDVDGRIVEFNPAAERMFGLRAAEVIGRGLSQVIIPERLRPAYDQTMAHYHATGEGPVLGKRIEIIALRADGTEFPVELSINRIPGLDPLLFSGFIRDISERRQMGEARSRLAAIVESSDDAIVSKDLQGIITSWNAGAEKLFGYTAEEAVGKPITMLMPPERFNEEPGILERIRHGERVSHYETVRRRKDGTLRDVSLTISPLVNNQGQIVGASKIARDITESKRVQTDLRAAHELLGSRAKQLENLVEERTAALRKINEELVSSLARQDKLTDELRDTVQQLETFSYSIVHDMRAPLRSMQSFASFLESEYRDKLDAKGLDYLHRIMGSAIRMDALITDVLTYSRISSGETPLSRVHLDKLVTEIVENYPQFKEAAASIHIEQPLPAVHGNPALLTQIISNLLGNALKFVPPHRTPRVTVRSENGAGKVRLWFEDNGIGIAPENQEQIFELFKRLHRPDEYAGTGVGLAVVRKAAARMGGKVGVKSELGTGSRFWVELDASARPVNLAIS